jgi:uncharacterized protein (TIGR00730 family)
MNICVFCSAQDVDIKYRDAAAEFATLIAQRGHTLVWGGSNVGLMEVIATAAQKAGGKIVGVSVEFFRKNARTNADEMIFTKDLAERKKMLLERSDAFIGLVGGTGTVDEISEVIELKKYEKHTKPIAFLNTDGFYDGLKQQFDRMRDEGFLMFPLEEIVHFADTPEEAMDYIEAHAR